MVINNNRIELLQYQDVTQKNILWEIETPEVEFEKVIKYIRSLYGKHHTNLSGLKEVFEVCMYVTYHTNYTTTTTTTRRTYGKYHMKLMQKTLRILNRDSTKAILYVLYRLDFAHSTLISRLCNMVPCTINQFMKELVHMGTTIRMADTICIDKTKFLSFIKDHSPSGNRSGLILYQLNPKIRDIIIPIIKGIEPDLDPEFVNNVNTFCSQYNHWKNQLPKKQIDQGEALQCNNCLKPLLINMKHVKIDGRIYCPPCYKAL